MDGKTFNFPPNCCRCDQRIGTRKWDVMGDHLSTQNYLLFRTNKVHYYTTEVPVCEGCYQELLQTRDEVAEFKRDGKTLVFKNPFYQKKFEALNQFATAGDEAAFKLGRFIRKSAK